MTCINLLQYPSLPLRIFSRHLYRLYMIAAESAFASLLVILTYLFAPAELVVTGAHQGLKKDAFLFIFLARKWAIDKLTFEKHLSRAQNDALPFWLFLFPEGTVITKETLANSLAYGKKVDWSPSPQNVMWPKHTGLYTILHSMQPQITKLYDITIGFEGVTVNDAKTEYAFDVHTLPATFFQGRGPRRVHLHVREFDVKSLPGFSASSNKSKLANGTATTTTTPHRPSSPDPKSDPEADAFGAWLRDRWLEKDKMMDEFYKSGNFQAKTFITQYPSAPVQVIRIVPRLWDWGVVVGVWVLAFWLIRIVLAVISFVR
ncbi:hypothetical protein HDV00_006922 [Rhizophlyctis rosea]|nr:hypothetical protein HDV00_006922 [Rhizophlyctis rosea]